MGKIDRKLVRGRIRTVIKTELAIIALIAGSSTSAIMANW